MSKKVTDADIERGVEKVERMNAMFDKAIIPVLFVAALAVFIFGAMPKLMRNIKSKEEKPAEEYVYELNSYELRSKFMDELDMNTEKLQSSGYEMVPEMQGTTGITKQRDEKTIVSHFYNGASSYGRVTYYGLETCKRVDMQINNAMSISVAVTLEDETRVEARFSGSGFLAEEIITDTDTNEPTEIFNYVSEVELSALFSIYTEELEMLVG